MISLVRVDATTDLIVNNGAMITQTGDPNAPGIFNLGASTNMVLNDRLFLDAGGAVAVPIGNSTVLVRSNNSTVRVDGATILSVGLMRLYNGGDADLRSEVDSTSYGLAGAATSLSHATYNANHQIQLANGAYLESLGDIELAAGYARAGLQTVKVIAESRAFNKTAIPIPIPPAADALANSTSRVDLGAGTKVKAVRDVSLYAEGGARTITGFGRGKDLYREVLAAIGSFFSNLVGGGDLSLDIETGTSVDNRDSGIIVNGLVRAGSRNKQVLVLNEANQLANTSYTGLGYTNEMAQDITYAIDTISVSEDLQARINVLQGYMNNPNLSDASLDIAGTNGPIGSADPARQAWISEMVSLKTRQAASAGQTTQRVSVGPILAVEGNIVMRADYVQGSNTGTLHAPGDALILIHTHSGAMIQTSTLTIPNDEGGRITLNDVKVNNTPEVMVQSGNRGTAANYAFNMVSGEDAGEPKIEVVSYQPFTGSTGNTNITVNGDITNLRGLAFVRSNAGDIDIRADISAKTIQIEAAGNVIIGYTPGVRNVGGTPAAQDANGVFGGQYGQFFRTQQDVMNAFVRAVAVGGRIEAPVATSSFVQVPTEGRIRAGKNVYITADTLNINGLIQAGTGTFNVTINAGIDAEIAGLSGTTGRVLLFDTAYPKNPLVTASPNVATNTNVKVMYNFDTRQIELDNMVVQGGTVLITGKIVSTGAGRIEALDGFGRVNVVSHASTPVVINRVDLGADSSITRGLEGLVRITDTSRLVSAARGFLVTEFVRNGSDQLEVWNNAGAAGNRIERKYLNVVNGAPDTAGPFVEIVRPADRVSVSAAGSRTSSYTTKQNQDLILLTAETSTKVLHYLQKQLIVIGITGSDTTTYAATSNVTSDTTADLGSAPYIGASLGGADYGYALAATLKSRTDTSTGKVKTHDSVRWYKLGSGWRYYEWDRTIVTKQVYEHRLKADYPISIYFNGSSSSSIDIQTKGNVIFANTVLNPLGQTNITSTNGSILTAGHNVQLNTANTVLSAVNGSIRGLNGALRMDQTAAGTLTMAARDLIDVREMKGNMNLIQAATTARPGSVNAAMVGQVSLEAQGAIIQSAPIGSVGIVRGSDIKLSAQDGTIGSSEASPLQIDTDGGILTAASKGSMYLREMTGDLGVNHARSFAGDVTLLALDGSLLDRNNIEQRDLRTKAALEDLWTNELGLNGAGKQARIDQQVANLETERTQTYRDYWAARGNAASATFTLDAATEASLRRGVLGPDGVTYVGGWTDAMVTNYVTKQNALYSNWNATSTAYDAGYRYSVAVGSTEYTDITNGIGWSLAELTRSLRSGMVLQTGSTQLRVESANVEAAGNINLKVRDNVGELLPDYVITGGGRLTDAEVALLFAADRQDITVDTVLNQVRVRQKEDFNFGFTAKDTLTNDAFGKLQVVASNREIFMAARTPASISEISGTGAVELRIDGNLTDARTGSQAIRGKIILVEAGNNGTIGRVNNPLTVDVLTGGNLTARSGIDVYIKAPNSDLPLNSVFSGGMASLTASGAITDVVGADVARIVAKSVILDGASIGTAGQLVGLNVTDATNGTVKLKTTLGDAYVKGFSKLRLSSADLAGGGRILVPDPDVLELVGTNTVKFGAASTLLIEVPAGVVNTNSAGTDFAGGRLNVLTNNTLGSSTKRVVSDLATLDFAAIDQASTTSDTSLWLQDLGSLRLERALMNRNPGSVTDVKVVTDLSVGTATSVSTTRLNAGRDITDGRIIAELVEMIAGRHIGGTTRMDVTAAKFEATTLANGNANILLRDRDTTINFITLNGAGNLDLEGRNGATTLAAGAGMTTGGGYINGRFVRFTANGDIGSAGGNILLTVLTDYDTGANVDVTSGTGTLELAVTGKATLGDNNTVVTTNATNAALKVTVGSALSAGAQAAPVFQANAANALTTLRLGQLVNVGPVGLRIQVARLDSSVVTGATHLREEDGVTVESIISQNGNVDLYTGGDTVLKVATSAGALGGTVVIGSGGALIGDTPTVNGTLLKLFAFGGRLGGVTAGSAMAADTATGAEVWLLARDGLNYAETAGDLKLASALSLTGDATIVVNAGSLTAGVLGAAGNMVLTSEGSAVVNMIGRSQIDIADENALALADDAPTRYGVYQAAAPVSLTMTALGAGSNLKLGLGNVKGEANLYASTLDAFLYDVTPTDGLTLRLSDAAGGFATTDVNVIGDGPQIDLTNPFADVRPLLDGRLLARTRPEDTALSTAEGVLTVAFARIEGGQVTHAGTQIDGQDIVVNSDVWFRQRSFDLLVNTVYRELDTKADAQALAWLFDATSTLTTGKVSFNLKDELVLTTQFVFPLNRRLGGVDLNGGQGFVFGVGAETQVFVNPFLRNIGPIGSVEPIFWSAFGVSSETIDDEEGPKVRLPMVLASL